MGSHGNVSPLSDQGHWRAETVLGVEDPEGQGSDGGAASVETEWPRQWDSEDESKLVRRADRVGRTTWIGQRW